jgi:PilZ domain-containing protein
MTSSSHHDQRIFPRRPSAPVPVALYRDAATAVDWVGQVLDYSPSGLSVRVDQPLPIGLPLTIRIGSPAGAEPSFAVRVKNCHAQPDHWRLGCVFVPRQHWDDLTVFG